MTLQIKWFRHVITFITALAGLIYFIRFYPVVIPESVIVSGVTKDSIRERAKEVFTWPEVDIPVMADSYQQDIRLKTDETALRYLQETYGLEKSQLYMRDSVPVYRWEIQWVNRLNGGSGSKFHIGISGSQKDREEQSKERKPLLLQFERNGRLCYFESRHKDFGFSVSDTEGVTSEIPVINRKTVTPDSVRKVVASFLQRAGYTDQDRFVEKILIPLRSRMAGGYQLVYSEAHAPCGFEHTRVFRVRQGRVAFFEDRYDRTVQSSPSDYSVVRTAQNLSETIAVLILTLMMLIYFFRKFGKGAVDLHVGLFFGLVAALSFGAMMFALIYDQTWWIVALVLVFSSLFWFLISGITVTVGASAIYDVWPEKYKTFEAIKRGHIFNRRFGKCLLDGIQYAMILSGFLILTLRNIPGASVVLNEEMKLPFGPYDALHVISGSLAMLMVTQHAFYPFLLSLLRRISRNTFWVWFSGIILGIAFPLVLLGAMPISVRLIVGLIHGFALTYIFLRWDFLTAFVTGWVMLLLFNGGLVVLYGDWTQIVLLGGFLAVLLGMAIAGYLSRQSGEDILEYTPEYVKAIENKQRMEREFEIAREIQTTMLCRRVPTVSFLEIATLCEPAYEVGGDYYDFITEENNPYRIGIVIGDVSGKGVSAAFHMTLIKGILQTQAAMTAESPRETLCRVNDVFYDLIRRDKFISMIYALFDFHQGVLRLARAGHNPLLIMSSSAKNVEMLVPKGIALGLKKGKVFCERLEETSVRFRSGDLFVFYTDGFSEAMNRNGEEYGDERLEAIFRQTAAESPQTIIQAIHQDVIQFTGAIPQHDDMTMIVVKIR